MSTYFQKNLGGVLRSHTKFGYFLLLCYKLCVLWKKYGDLETKFAILL